MSNFTCTQTHADNGVNAGAVMGLLFQTTHVSKYSFIESILNARVHFVKCDLLISEQHVSEPACHDDAAVRKNSNIIMYPTSTNKSAELTCCISSH